MPQSVSPARTSITSAAKNGKLTLPFLAAFATHNTKCHVADPHQYPSIQPSRDSGPRSHVKNGNVDHPSQLSLSPSVSLRVPPCPSVSLRVPPCPSVSLRVPPCPSVSLRVPPCPSVSLRVPPCPSVSLRVPPCPSVSLRVPPCPSVSLRVPPCPSVAS